MSETKIKKIDGSQIEISGEISAETFNNFRSLALKKLSEKIEINGFRKGKAPENILTNKIGEEAILEEAAEMAIEDFYYKFILENKLGAIGHPQVKITKLAKDNPLSFVITTAVMPEIILPDYKAIARKINLEAEGEIVVATDEEISKILDEIREGQARMKLEPEQRNKIKKEELLLPTLSDEFAKSVGNFNTLEELKAQLRNNVMEEKKARQREKNRMSILEKIAEDTKIDVPSVIIESELSRIIAEMEHNLTKLGMSLEDFLKNQNKTIDKIREESRDTAKKRAVLNLILKEVAKKENLQPSDEDIENETKKLIEQYKEADPATIKSFVIDILINDKAFLFLEGAGESKPKL